METKRTTRSAEAKELVAYVLGLVVSVVVMRGVWGMDIERMTDGDFLGAFIALSASFGGFLICLIKALISLVRVATNQ